MMLYNYIHISSAEELHLLKLNPGSTYNVILEGVGDDTSDVIELQFKTKDENGNKHYPNRK